MRPFHMDTIANNSPNPRLIGAHMGGTGNYDEIADHVTNLERIFDQIELAEDERDRIRYRNAAEIFGEAEPVHPAE